MVILWFKKGGRTMEEKNSMEESMTEKVDEAQETLAGSMLNNEALAQEACMKHDPRYAQYYQ
jgi:hypothetical protein